MKLATEISRVDCRLFAEGKLSHYFTLDRISEDMCLVSGITFKLDRKLLDEIISCARKSGFRFVRYERPHRVITYDICENRFSDITKKE